jgi:histidinol phosphatase-like enzyme
MKVIFLDIDGVLNCDKTPNPRKFPYIVDKKLLVKKAIRSHGRQGRAFVDLEV